MAPPHQDEISTYCFIVALGVKQKWERYSNLWSRGWHLKWTPVAPVSPRPPTPMKQKSFLFSSYFCWGGDGSWWHWGSRWDQKPLREASWQVWLLLGDTRHQALAATAGHVAILRIMENLDFNNGRAYAQPTNSQCEQFLSWKFISKDFI